MSSVVAIGTKIQPPNCLSFLKIIVLKRNYSFVTADTDTEDSRVWPWQGQNMISILSSCIHNEFDEEANEEFAGPCFTVPTRQAEL